MASSRSTSRENAAGAEAQPGMTPGTPWVFTARNAVSDTIEAVGDTVGAVVHTAGDVSEEVIHTVGRVGRTAIGEVGGLLSGVVGGLRDTVSAGMRGRSRGTTATATPIEPGDDRPLS